MGRMLDIVENLLSGTPLEKPARAVYSELASIGKPRARQSALYDRQTVEIMKKVLREDSACVDVGAHRGSVLLHMAEIARNGHLYAIEPLPDLAARLRARWRHQPNVRIFEGAVSDAPGEKTFYNVLASRGKSGFRVMAHVEGGARVQEIKVKVETLDRLVSEDVRVAFVKVDVEGAQLEVFRGAARILSRDKPYVVFEHGALAKESYGTTSDMIYDLLVERCGLQISLLGDWLAGGAPLTREAFDRNVGRHATSHFCFLAHP